MISFRCSRVKFARARCRNAWCVVWPESLSSILNHIVSAHIEAIKQPRFPRSFPPRTTSRNRLNRRNAATPFVSTPLASFKCIREIVHDNVIFKEVTIESDGEEKIDRPSR